MPPIDWSYCHDTPRADRVKGRGRKFRIAFGCVPGPMVGDGAEWDVEFDKAGRVIRIEPDTMWIS